MTELTDVGQVEHPSDFDNNPKGVVKRWLAEIDRAKKELEHWNKRVDKIIKRYKDERQENESMQTVRRFNVLWSNMQILQPSIYSQNPKLIVDRRFLDSDKVGRVSSEILERCLTTSMDQYDFKSAMCNARDEFLLGARGQGWARYIPLYGPKKTDPEGNEFQEVAWEEARAEYVAREDFLHEPAACWERVGWVAKKALVSYKQGLDRFGKIFEKVPLKDELRKPPSSDGTDDREKPLWVRAPVWEIWDKESRKVFWICPDYEDEPLDVQDDPLRLVDFFPCPRPMFGTTAPGSLVPIPDYSEYQDQALELDALTERIHYITKALKVVGGYNAAMPELSQMLEDGTENKVIPVTGWTELSENGGLERQMGFLPIDKFQMVLTGLVQIRDMTKRDLDEISGMSDIIRGQSVASESATAQRIKGNFATLRLQDKQKEMERFARDMLRIKAEIMAEHFAPNTLRLMSGFDSMPENETEVPDAQPQAGPPLPPGAPGVSSAAPAGPGAPMQPSPRQAADQRFADAMALLKNDKMRTFRVSIETESTIGVDREQEKKDRTEFIMATAQFLQNALGIGQGAPELQELLAHLLMFGVRGFRVGRELEQEFEITIEKMRQKQKAMASQPPKPTPEEIKAKTQMDVAQLEAKNKLQIAQLTAQSDLQSKQMESSLEERRIGMAAQVSQAEQQSQARLKELEFSHDTQLEHVKAQAEMQTSGIDVQMKQMDLEIKRAELELKKEEIAFRKIELEMEMQMEQFKAQQVSMGGDSVSLGKPSGAGATPSGP